jgi:hypothetical protein
VDHEYDSIYDGGVLRFSNDSRYLYSSNFSDYLENWDSESEAFKGKIN